VARMGMKFATAQALSTKLRLLFENGRAGQLRADEGAGHGAGQPRSDKMLQCEPLSVILGSRDVVRHSAASVR
jgi:hypothetical protein